MIWICFTSIDFYTQIFYAKVNLYVCPKAFMKVLIFINPNQDRPFGEYSQIGRWQKGPLPKSCHTYLAMKKLDKVITYLKNI